LKNLAIPFLAVLFKKPLVAVSHALLACSLLASTAAAAGPASAVPVKASAQEPSSAIPVPEPLDAAGIHHALRRLDVLGSVLYIAAHPDDENTRLLAHLAKGRQLRTGYLSLTRGDGGQNLIGPEQGDVLGLIRTWELLKARAVDGAEQFFTRAVDFGYSKSPQESLEKWGRDSVLSDVVRIIREFKPDVIITRFTPVEGGHGHHLASAMLALEAFAAAADPSRFPEQVGTLGTWKTRRLFWNAWRPEERPHDPALIPLDVGAFDPLLGMSWAEIAALSRNNHKSQGFGTKPQRGAEEEKLKPMAGDTAALAAAARAGKTVDPFAGLDLGWSRVKGGEAVSALVRRTLQGYDFTNPGRSLPLVLQIRSRLAAMPSSHWTDLKLREADALLAALMGLWAEATVETPLAVGGATLPLEIRVIARALSGWTLERLSLPFRADTVLDAALERNIPVTVRSSLAVPADQPVTHPYWLAGAPGERDLHAVPDTALLGEPAAGPAAAVAVTLRHKYGTRIRVTAPVRHARLDKVRGEIFEPFAVAPAATVGFADEVLVFPDASPREARLAIRCMGDSVRGEARLRLPAGWTSEPASRPFALVGRNAEARVAFRVKPGSAAFRGQVAAELAVDGRTLDRGHLRLEYGHIPAQSLFPAARAGAVRADIRAGRERVGYVMGAGDLVPEALRQLGYPVALLDESALAGDLSRFDVIIAGVRAFNTRKDLAQARGRILDWVKAGGRLIAQYNVSSGLVTPHLGPFPFKLTRDRVTVEEAPVALLDPAHPLLAGPNRLGPADFEGWVQERGLYFAGDWDPAYVPLLEAADPGEKPSRGILLFARHGKGSYVYTGLSLFRQLPAGVPGAYRLLANLVSAKTGGGAAAAPGATAPAPGAAKGGGQDGP
jgi:LmbE family N-acetylglucosaminyl deacetylase